MLKVCKTKMILYDVSEIDEPPTPRTAIAGPTAEDAMQLIIFNYFLYTLGAMPGLIITPDSPELHGGLNFWADQYRSLAACNIQQFAKVGALAEPFTNASIGQSSIIGRLTYPNVSARCSRLRWWPITVVYSRKTPSWTTYGWICWLYSFGPMTKILL